MIRDSVSRNGLTTERSLEILSKCKIDDMLVVIELDQVLDAR